MEMTLQQWVHLRQRLALIHSARELRRPCQAILEDHNQCQFG